MALGARAAVLATPAAPPRTGLIASAREINRVEESGPNSDVRWETSFGYEPENYCSGNGVADPCATTAKTADGSLEIVQHDPVVLWASDQCSSLSNARDRQFRARRRLVACQSKLLAGELWNGTLAIAADMPNKRLASPASNVLGTAALGPVDALACLEEGLASCSCSRAMIHVTPGYMTHLARFNLVTRMGNAFVTANDTLVVADAGYTGDGPDGEPPANGSVWAYGTDVVEVRLSDIDVYPGSDAEAMDLSPEAANTLTYRAERLAAATWDGCCHVAVEIDIPVCANPQAS